MTVKDFSEYIKGGIAVKRSPDISRAKALFKEAENSYRVIKAFNEKMSLDDKNANYFIKNAYDIIMELIRARMLFEGYSASGKGAHEAEVSYLRKIGFKETEVTFADKLRYFRNGILYYGKDFDKEYAEKVLDFMKKIHQKLKK